MRQKVAVLLSAASCLAILVIASCSDSNMVTSPAATGSLTTSSANIAGSWSGRYEAFEPKRCEASTATASFTQNGSSVTGILKTNGCGVAGSFKGTLTGDNLMGLIDMAGCVGGGVSGTIHNGEITLSIGDMTKPLITGDTVIMSGGSLTLRR